MHIVATECVRVSVPKGRSVKLRPVNALGGGIERMNKKLEGAPNHICMGVRGAVIAASCVLAGLASAASAADLGGNCCADLEERIAELEATTARKGNRKVSLTVTGYIAQEITWWDDGKKRNVYEHGLGPTQATNVRFTGQAQIAPGWTAGYMLRIQNLDNNPFGRNPVTGAAMNQFNDNFSTGLNVQMSYWYIQSKDLGKISVGRQAQAAKSAVMFTDLSGTQIIDNYTFLAGFPQFIIRSGGDLNPASLTWGQLGYCYSQAAPIGGDCNGIVMNGVRYDTPVWNGLSAAASWGENDFWEVALRYSGEFSGLKVALGAGYSENRDESVGVLPAFSRKATSYVQAGGYVQHLATGLFVHGAYGHEDNSDTRIGALGVIPPNSDHWYIKSGIRQNWTGLGATIVYGDFAEYEDQVGPAALALGVRSSTLTRYGGGIAQELDAAAMTVYIKYQHYDADASGPALSPLVTDLNGLDLFSVGGLINF